MGVVYEEWSFALWHSGAVCYIKNVSITLVSRTRLRLSGCPITAILCPASSLNAKGLGSLSGLQIIALALRPFKDIVSGRRERAGHHALLLCILGTNI